MRRNSKPSSSRRPPSCAPRSSRSARRRLAGLLLLTLLAACQDKPDYPNRPLAPASANAAPPSLASLEPTAPIVLIAFSGGGSRAAALGLGVLDELATAGLADRVKVVSSVSGGSVIAAWFALVGPGHMDELRDRFLARDNMATLERQALDPITIGRLLFTRETRSDVFRELLDRELFGGRTFADLRRPGAPYLILNATDMETGEVFAFTPDRFDDICSDLGGLPISVGVASSAAFPVALSPMNLRNYSYPSCPAGLPAPRWVSQALRPGGATPYVALEEYKRARYANALRNAPGRFRAEPYVHLLDGGLADNQGVHTLSDALLSPHSPVHLQDAISRGDVHRIVVIAVNARGDVDPGVGTQEAIPGLVQVLGTVIGVPIDSTVSYANASLEQLVSDLNAAAALAPQAPGAPRFAGLRVYGVPIDFDQFPPEQAALQVRVKNVGTTWTLAPADVQDSIDAGRLLLRQHPCYQHLLLDLGAPVGAADADRARNQCP